MWKTGRSIEGQWNTGWTDSLLWQMNRKELFSQQVNYCEDELISTVNRIGDKGAELLGEALKKNTSLNALDLSCNG